MIDLNEMNKQVINEFRTNGGKVGGPFAGTDILLLTTIGAKSGQPRINPLAYLPDGDRIIIIASKGGSPNHPAWYHNLLANPKVTVEVGTETFEATATFTSGEERDQLYAKVAAHYPQFNDYQKNTDRVIPVVVLQR